MGRGTNILADAPGPAYLAYTPNGRKLITVGTNSAIRIFQHGSDDEPAIIDVLTENHTAVVATNEFFIVGAEDGTVTKYSLISNSMEQMLTRCSLPVRDITLSNDGEWIAVASDELEVKVVSTQDMEKVMHLREQSRPVKHVSFDTSGTMLAVSCTDGMVYLYSLSSEQPQLVKRIDGLIKTLETDSEASAKVSWHPDGRAFAVPTSTRGAYEAIGYFVFKAKSFSQISRSWPGVIGSARRLSRAAIEPISVHLHGLTMGLC